MDGILKYWDLAGRTAAPLDVSHEDLPHNAAFDIGGQYVLKHYAEPSELPCSIRVANLLGAEGVPVAVYIPTRGGQYTTPDGMYCLMTKLKGGHEDLYEQPDLASVLGRGLARLHTALVHIESEVNSSDNGFLAEWRNYIKPGLGSVPDEITEYAETRLFRLYKGLPVLGTKRQCLGAG